MNKGNSFYDVTYDLAEIYEKKNQDYGNSFEKSMDEDGLIVAKIRLGDKFRRFSELITHEAQVKDETLEDTLIDMANYTILSVMWLRKNKVKDGK